MRDWGPDVQLTISVPADVADDLDFVALRTGTDRATAAGLVLTEWARGVPPAVRADVRLDTQQDSEVESAATRPDPTP
jgi:hypothetical protein